MIGLVVDEVAAQKERMTLGERQTETKTFGEVVDFDKRLENKLLNLDGQAWTHILNDEENIGVVLHIGKTGDDRVVFVDGIYREPFAVLREHVGNGTDGAAHNKVDFAQ